MLLFWYTGEIRTMMPNVSRPSRFVLVLVLKRSAASAICQQAGTTHIKGGSRSHHSTTPPLHTSTHHASEGQKPSSHYDGNKRKLAEANEKSHIWRTSQPTLKTFRKKGRDSFFSCQIVEVFLLILITLLLAITRIFVIYSSYLTR